MKMVSFSIKKDSVVDGSRSDFDRFANVSMQRIFPIHGSTYRRCAIDWHQINCKYHQSLSKRHPFWFKQSRYLTDRTQILIDLRTYIYKEYSRSTRLDMDAALLNDIESIANITNLCQNGTHFSSNSFQSLADRVEILINLRTYHSKTFLKSSLRNIDSALLNDVNLYPKITNLYQNGTIFDSNSLNI